MTKYKRTPSSPALENEYASSENIEQIGLVLSGGGARAAYQVGAIKALVPYFNSQKNIRWIIIGSSVGAINGLIFAACLKEGVEHAALEMERLWKKRTFRSTFEGSPSMAFLRAIKVAALQYLAPGPNPSNKSVFDPTPLQKEIDYTLDQHGGLSLRGRDKSIKAIGVMTTIEGNERKPLLFLSAEKDIDANDEIMSGAAFNVYNVRDLRAHHGFASAALPAILPPVQLDTSYGKVTLVDGGISSNIPVDPAVRLGATKVIIVDVSGRHWWLSRYNQPLDKRPAWEVLSGLDTFCLFPPETLNITNQKPLGPLLKEAVGSSRSKFISAVGPTWPLYTLLNNKLGNEAAYETMSYVALDPDYLQAVMLRGYTETRQILRNYTVPEFAQAENFKQWAEDVDKANK